MKYGYLLKTMGINLQHFKTPRKCNVKKTIHLAILEVESQYGIRVDMLLKMIKKMKETVNC